MLDDAADCGSGFFEFIQRADFGGVLIRHVLVEQRLRKRVWKYDGTRRWEGQSRAEHGRNVTLPIDGMVPFIGGGGVEAAVRIADVAAQEIAERTVVTGGRIVAAAGRIVAARAIGFAGARDYR